MVRLTIRVDFEGGDAVGPGKVGLLEQIAATGSIRKAASAMKMSYRRAWLLLKATEATFGVPLVVTATGGKQGGGARLTPVGAKIVRAYRAIENTSERAGRAHLSVLAGARKLDQRRQKVS